MSSEFWGDEEMDLFLTSKKLLGEGLERGLSCVSGKMLVAWICLIKDAIETQTGNCDGDPIIASFWSWAVVLFIL